MEFHNIYLHPEESFRERRARAHKLTRPFLEELYARSPEARKAFYSVHIEPDGTEYLINCDGERRPIPYWGMARYNGEPIDLLHPYDPPWSEEESKQAALALLAEVEGKIDG